jgi:fucose 4-O-acetylase-like acetyltransferase
MINKEHNKLTHITLLKVIAITLVVLGHATRNIEAPNLHLFYPEYTSGIEVFIKKYIYSFHMPLFFWISGYVFYFTHTKQQFSMISDFKKKVKRLIVPLYATSFLVLLPTMVLFGNLDVPIWKQVLFMLQMNANDHLWFLKVLFLIFLIVIPLSFYIKREKTSILIIITILLVLIHINITFPINELNITSKYLPYFILGSITRKSNKEVNKNIILFTGILLFILHFTIFYFVNNTEYFKFINEYLVYITAIIGIYSYYYLATFLSKIKLPTQLWDTIQIIDKNSYSIYLFHIVFLYIVLYLYKYFEFESSLIRILTVFFLGIIIPIYIQQFLSKNRYSAFLFAIKYIKNG